MVARAVVMASVLLGGARAACPEDPEVDLCDLEVDGAWPTRPSMMPMLLFAGALGGKSPLLMLPLFGAVAEAAGSSNAGTCGAMKDLYKQEECCGNPTKETGYLMVPKPNKKLFAQSTNMCNGQKPAHVDATANNGAGDNYWSNIDCIIDGVKQTLEQAGANVTAGYEGDINATGAGRIPLLTSYFENGLCPVNVHWHLGAEHLSVGQYDEQGVGPAARRLGTDVRQGFRCHHYDATDVKFTTEYDWKHCVGMKVGETYEVHWPHSAAGACGTPFQYQTPFYDGVFCKGDIISLNPLNTWQKIGVQAQVYTIVNDEDYYFPDMFRGWIVDGSYGQDIAKYTGSTTGTSRDNTVCSRFTPITWQVDRTCHLISASSFDKMCADMKEVQDDMSDDLHAHGARELVADEYASDNLHRI